MQFVVQSEIKLASVECHVHLCAAGSALPLHILCSSFAHALLSLSLERVRNTSSSPWCRMGALWDGDAIFVEAAERCFSREEHEHGLEGAALGVELGQL